MCPSNPIDLEAKPRAAGSGVPDGALRNPAMLDELAHLGAEEIERGDFAAAERILRQGLAQNPQHPRCLAYLAMCVASGGGDLPRAEEMARSVTRDHPREPAGWFALGQVELLAGRRGPAFQHLAQARRLAGRDRDLRERIARRDPRRVPVFKSLPRENVLNRVCGRLSFLRRGR